MQYKRYYFREAIFNEVSNTILENIYILLCAGSLKQTDFVETTWWKTSSGPLLLVCPSCEYVSDADRDTEYSGVCVHTYLFPLACMGLGIRDDFLAAVAASVEFSLGPLNRVIADFLKSCATESSRVKRLRAFGSKTIFLAILTPEMASQYGLSDKKWSLCTMTKQRQKNMFLIRCQSGRCSHGSNKVIKGKKDARSVCGHSQAILTEIGFNANFDDDSESNADGSGADDDDCDSGNHDRVAFSQGVTWSDDKGEYVADDGCTKFPIPRHDLDPETLRCIRDRLHLNDVVRDGHGVVQTHRNGWLVGTPLQPRQCDNCCANLLEITSECRIPRQGQVVVHSLTTSVVHDIVDCVCPECGNGCLWQAHCDAVHLISKEEGG